MFLEAIDVCNGIEKSKSDERSYKYLELENKLGVLLISDSKTVKSGAALDVNVGHFSDPEDTCQGLAHFLEHMLFMGSEKYPDENDYSAFLNENGGKSNAYTSMENTNYYFDVGHKELKGALDRFAQFFISPLCSESSTDRELNAVDSEHSKNLQDDMWRTFQLEKTTSNPAHPYCKFATGDSKTLRDEPGKLQVNVRERLLKFHDQHYSANRMKLVILGRNSLEELEEWADELFGSIPNSDLEPPSFNQDGPFTEEQMGRRIDVVPVKDLRSIELTWSLDSMRSKYKQGNHRYIANLVGHEGPGSILSVLKDLGWVNELSAGLSYDTSSFSFFKISVECTVKGIEFVDDIIEMIFAFLKLIKENNYQGVEKWRWEEVATQTANSFRFQSQSPPFNVVSRVASSMQKFPIEHVLSGSLLREYDREGIIEFLDNLLPRRVQVMVISQHFEEKCELKERWYGTKHTIYKIDESILKQWESPSKVEKLYLPVPNEFLPSDFTIHSFVKPIKVSHPSIELPEMVPSYNLPTNLTTDPNKLVESLLDRSILDVWSSEIDEDIDIWRPPVLIDSGDHGLVWLKQDTVFKRPKGAVTILMHTQVVHENPVGEVLSDLYSMMIQDLLTEYAYAADVSGLHYSFRTTSSGLSLTAGGFTHKLQTLLLRIVETVTNPTLLAEKEFQRFREKLKLTYANFDKEQPYQHAIYELSVMISTPKWHVDERIKLVDSIKLDDLHVFVEQVLQSTTLETIVTGNFIPTQAIEYAKLVHKNIIANFPTNSTLVPVEQTKILKLPPNMESYYFFEGRDPDNINSAIEYYLQIGPDTTENKAKLQLLAQIAQEPCFNELRTKQQLGYIVFCGYRNDTGILGLRIIVQSSNANPYEIDQKIEDFLTDLEKLLLDMEPNVFNQNVSAVLATLLEKDKTVFSETRRWVQEIDQKFFKFSRAIDVATAIASLTKQQIVEFFQSRETKKLVVGSFGANHVEKLEIAKATVEKTNNRQIVTKQFKQTTPSYPVQSNKL